MCQMECQKEWQIECQTMSKECRVFPKFPRWTSSSMSQGFSTQRFARRSAWFSCLVLAAPLNDFEANHFKTLFGVHVRHFLGGYWNPDHAKEPCFFLGFVVPIIEVWRAGKTPQVHPAENAGWNIVWKYLLVFLQTGFCTVLSSQMNHYFSYSSVLGKHSPSNAKVDHL